MSNLDEGAFVDLEAPRIVAEELEQALCQIPDIKAARIVTSSGGRNIAEIHVLALPTKQPKQLVRDIESALIAEFGVEVDHKTISIAQVRPEALEPEDAVGPRPRIVSINTDVHGVRSQATVSLEIDEEIYVGNASGPASQTQRGRLVAQACLNAVEQFVPETFGFALEDVSIVQLGRQQVAVACVSLVSPIGEQCFAGSATVRTNPNDSIVRATLDALNRRLGSLTAT